MKSFTHSLFVVGFAVFGWLGILIGAAPSMHVAAMRVIGRGTAIQPAPIPWTTVILASLFYAVIFLAFYVSQRQTARRTKDPSTSTEASAPTSLLERYWILALIVVILILIWWPYRQVGFAIRVDDDTTLSWQRSGPAETSIGAEALERWHGRLIRDEGREATGTYTLLSHGWGEFWERGKDSWLRQHPPLAYLLWAPLGTSPFALRGLSLLIFTGSLLFMCFWARRLGGDRMLLTTAMVLVSAPGLLQDLMLRLNLDVMTLPLGCLVGFVLFGEKKESVRRGTAATAKALLLLCTMMMTKFTTVILLPGLVLAKLRDSRIQALLLGFVPSLVFVAYHATVVFMGLPFEQTYLGDVLGSIMGEHRDYAHGGHRRSFTTLLVFVLSPLGALVWVGGLLAALRIAILSRASAVDSFNPSQRRPPWLAPALIIAGSLLVVIYTLHPLLRYTTPGLWAIVLPAAFGLDRIADRIPATPSALSAAAAYSLAKLLGESWL